MWIVLLFLILGFIAGYLLEVPVTIFNTKFLALGLVAVLDSLSLSIYLDKTQQHKSTSHVLTRLIMSLMFGGLIIYFGEKTGVDLFLVAMLPLTFGLAINLYKFLPK